MNFSSLYSHFVSVCVPGEDSGDHSKNKVHHRQETATVKKLKKKITRELALTQDNKKMKNMILRNLSWCHVAYLIAAVSLI